MKPFDVLLALGLALRATRFITSDTLGEWLIVGPAKRWALRDITAPATATDTHKDEIERLKALALDDHSMEEQNALIDYGTEGPGASKRARLVKGLDCPFCVGFWITGSALLAGLLASRGPRRRTAFRFIAGVFTANYVTGHIGARLD